MNNKLFALFAAALLLLSGCAQVKETNYKLDEVTTTLDSALEEGHFFFAGKVLTASTTQKMITYYDVSAEAHSVYQVQVTEDYFECMPEEPITVCVYGTKSNFNERVNLTKGEEYIFDVTLWVQEDQVIYLLPTFYESMPQKDGESLYYTADGKTAVVKGGYSAYRSHLLQRAKDLDYTPKRVLDAMAAMMKDAALRDAAFFKEKDFAKVDETLLKRTTTKASELLKRIEGKAPAWESISRVLAS